jgi:RNA polymerase sigma factor (sigma-70 family)
MRVIEGRVLTPEQAAMAAGCVGLAFLKAGEVLRRRPHADADEVLSAALLAVAKAPFTYDPARGVKFESYAGQSAALQAWRAVAPEGQPPKFAMCGGDPAAPYEPHPLEVAEEAHAKAEALAALLRLLDRLPDRERQAVRLRHLRGMSLMAISLEMGVSKERVRQIARRGERRLRELAEEEGVIWER